MTLPYFVTFSYNHNYCDSDGETLQKRIVLAEFFLLCFMMDPLFQRRTRKKEKPLSIFLKTHTHTRHPTIFEKNEFCAIESSSAFYFTYIFSCFTSASWWIANPCVYMSTSSHWWYEWVLWVIQFCSIVVYQCLKGVKRLTEICWKCASSILLNNFT
jgi:hypothetical protein